MLDETLVQRWAKNFPSGHLGSQKNPIGTHFYGLASKFNSGFSHDLQGRLIITLLNEELPAGYHETEWDGRDASGMYLPGGIYFSRLESSGQVTHGMMTILR